MLNIYLIPSIYECLGDISDANYSGLVINKKFAAYLIDKWFSRVTDSRNNLLS